MKKIYTHILFLITCLLTYSVVSAQRKYADIYADMPNMSLDQIYSELMSFQKQNPHFANTYIQLGIVCEHKMAHTDPLRDIESAVFWAENAHLFFGNFLVFYQSGDYRSNSEYYENLNIPHSGNKITEDDIKAFVSSHEKKCKNFRDSTLMIYTAIEKSKSGYNKCIQAYMKLCEQFVNYNEMLLAYGPDVEAKLKKIEDGISVCENEFKEYKRLIKAYPILNYRQIYDTKNIETYRLDGLTYSDFYENRFLIWNFKKWTDDYRAELNKDILPLRREIEKIDDAYRQGKLEYEKNAKLSAALISPYDELFLFRLGKYDNNSLIRELFAYLELRRNMIAMAGDSLAIEGNNVASLMNRKMRHIYKLYALKNQALQQLKKVDACITPERIARFSDFFNKKYGGESGLKKYSAAETLFMTDLENSVLHNFVNYCDAIAELQRKASFSTKGKAVAVPTWCVGDYEVGQVTGNYITQQVVRDNYGRPIIVAGVKKNDLKSPFVAKVDEQNVTSWLTEVKNATNVVALSATTDGCVVCTNVKEKPTAIVFDKNGKERLRYGLHSANVAFIAYNEMTKMTHSAFNDENGVTFCLTDSLGKSVSELQLNCMDKAIQMQHVTDGAIVVGLKNGNIVVVKIPDIGIMLEPTIIKGNSLTLKNIFRASASEICIFLSDANDNASVVIVDADGQLHRE